MRTIQARIHGDALKRVARFFDATFPETLSEVLQNARRSGARNVDIELQGDGSVVITDDGDGIADPAALLSFGESQWDKATQEGEGAAGMGRLTSNPADALASVVWEIAERTIAYEVKAGQSVTITVARDTKGEVRIQTEAR